MDLPATSCRVLATATVSKMRIVLLLALWFASATLPAQTLEDLLADARYAEALEQLEIELRAQPNNATRQLQKADVLIRMGRFAEASGIVSSLDPQTAGARVLTVRGFLHLNQGRSDLAIDELNTALEGFQKSGQGQSLEAAETLAILSSAYLQQGKAAQAEQQMQVALAIRQKIVQPRSELMAASYNDLGLIYFEVDPDKALDYYEMALAIYRELRGDTHPKVAIAHTNMGVAYRQLKLYGDAVNDFEQARSIWNAIYAGSHPSKGFVEYNLGLTYREMGNLTAARDYYANALREFETSYGKRHPEAARVWNSLGELFLFQAQFDSSIWAYHRSMMANVSGFDVERTETNPATANFDDGFVLLNSLNGKALAWEERHFGKTLKQRDLETSLSALHAADTLIDRLRQQINLETDKINLSSNAQSVYANAVRVCHQLSLTALTDRKGYAEMAFYFAEKSKSAVLQDAIAESNAKSFANIPESLLREESDLKARLALVAQKLAQKPDAGTEQALRQELFQLNRDYQQFVAALEKNYPGYYNLKFSRSTMNLRQVQSKLLANEALISYFLDEAKSRLFIFVVTSGHYRMHTRTLPENFERYITGLRNSLQFQNYETFERTAGPLGKLLLPKLPGSVDHIIFLPAGRLSAIPFEVLPLSRPRPANFASYPYLVRKYATSYLFSAGMLQAAQPGNSEPANALMCAPVEFPETTLAALPGTEQELQEISNLLAQHKYTVNRLVRDDASEQALKSESLSKYEVIHLATHGVVDENQPELSRIFMSPGNQEDGQLYSGELYNLRFNARLVTLSACETGLGKISRGEGVIGLSRALLYAGAKNLIVSYWSVADESTAQLMVNFYRPVVTFGHPFSRALREAKLQLMKDNPKITPFHWAPFILIGRD
jgi:CHAT domain-containing protein/tetratricopeptide (TPR) repeat protein